MTVRMKTAAVLLVAMLGVVLSSWGALRLILLPEFVRLERESMVGNLERVRRAVDEETASLSRSAADWAFWDDTYAFMVSQNPQYVDANLTPEAFTSAGYDLMVWLDTSAHLVLARTLDPERTELVRRPPASLERWLSRDGPLVAPHAATRGLVLLREGPMLVAASPILTSSNEGPAHGTFIVGRRLPANWRDTLSKLTGLAVEVHRLDGGALDPSLEQALASLAAGEQHVIGVPGPSTVAGHLIIPDLGNQPALLIRVSGPRTIYARGVGDLRYLLAALALTGVISFGVMAGLLEWLVLARLRRLDQGLADVARRADPAGRVEIDGNDELATLARAVNHTLDALDRSQAALRQANDQLERRVAERTADLERAIAALRESEERYRSLVEKLNDVIFAVDADGFITFVSQVVERLAGWPVMELIGTHFTRVVHPDDHKALQTSFARTLAGALEPAEFRMLARDGRELHVRTSSQPIVDKGRVTGIRGVLTDLTAEREAQARVRFLASAVESINESVSITDLDGHLVFVNRAFMEMYGFTEAELLGHSIRLVQLPDTPAELLREINLGTLAGGWTGEVTNVRKDGTRLPILLSTSVLRDADGEVRGLIGVATDVQERRRLEEQLRVSQRMEAVGHLAGGIAHDFNNLLTVILGAAEIVRRGLPPDSALHTELATVSNAVADGSRLTNALLAYAQQQRLEPVELNLTAMIGTMVPLLRRLLPENITLDFVVGPEDLGVRADRGQLEQVLINLCVNARDAMPRGGVLSIATDSVTLAEDAFDHDPWGVPGRYACIRLTDTGIGMDAQTLEHLFEPFFTTKDLGRGSGLGLATVYGIVRQHMGTIEVTSTRDAGTTFRILLPAIIVVPQVLRQTPPSTLVASGSETVLVVEDQDDLRQTTARYLAIEGYRILEARDGEEALLILEREGSGIDLIFSDLIMPGIGGWELHSRCQVVAPRTPFLFTTGHAEQLTREGLVSGEGTAFIPKPYDLVEVTRRIRQLLDATPKA